MNTTNDLLLQMAAMALQFNQTAVPQVGGSRSESDVSFRDLLSNKRAESDAKPADRPQSDPTEKPEAEAPARPEEPGGQSLEARAAALGAAVTAAAVQQPAVEQPNAGLPDGAATALPVELLAPATAAVQQPAVLQEAILQQPAAVQQSEQADVDPQIPTGATEPAASPPQQTVQEPAAQPVVQTAGSRGEQQQEADFSTAQRPTGRQSEELPTVQTAETSQTPPQPLFDEVDAAPVRVGDGTVLNAEEPQFDAKLSGAIEAAVADGRSRVEIRLTPENLGSVVVEMSRSDSGVLHVVLRAESSHTADLLREHSASLSQLLQSSGQGEVRIEVPQPQERQQQFWQQPQQHDQQEQGRQRQQEHRPRQEEAEQFLHQLRLGLVQVDAALGT